VIINSQKFGGFEKRVSVRTCKKFCKKA